MKKIIEAAEPVIFAAADLDELIKQRGTLTAEADAILDTADAEGRDLTADELVQAQAITKRLDGINARIDIMAKLRAPTPARRTDPEPGNVRRTAVVPANVVRVEPRPIIGANTFGFGTFGEFAQTVRRACAGENEAVNRFTATVSTYGSEASGDSGGYVVPHDFRTAIWEKVNGEDSLLSRATPFVTSANSISFPKDETTPWDTSTGIQAYWEGEAGAVNASKPVFELDTLRLSKLMALVPVSEELLEDAPAIDSYLRAKTPAKMLAKINTALVRGNGVGKPLGILGASSLITVAAETSQDVSSILYANIVNMWARMYAPCRRNAVWLINQDCEPQLDQMAFRPDATSPFPVYLPTNGISASPFATLKGRPVIPLEACSTVGTVGDIILVDMTQYMALTKGQQIRTDVSMHLYFDQALMAFRFIFRVNGQPLWTSSITPENGSLTRSWAVALETRP